jgi:hypothetical protein
MNWYGRVIYAQNLQAFLQSLGLSPDVLQFISSLPPQEAQHYVNLVRQNPQITVQDLQSSVQASGGQQDMYFPEELIMASTFDNRAKNWILFCLKERRKSSLEIPHETLTYAGFSSQHPAFEYYKLWERLRRWDQTNSLDDFLRAFPNLQLVNLDPEDVDTEIDEWHKTMVGYGEGKMYGPTKHELIVYGPQWKNEKWNGWTIQEVRGENDLLAEGSEAKMDHCVGGYCNDVDSGELRIFSLRDPANEPHVTIETSPDLSNFDQIQGKSNSDPKPEYKEMIKEWTSSFDKPASFGDDDGVMDIPSYYNVEDVNERLKLVAEPESNEYGLITNITVDPDDLLSIIDQGQRENSRSREGDYWGDIADTPELFVQALLAEHGPEVIPKLEKVLNILEMDNDFYSKWDYTPSTNRPDRNNYETDEEYEKAEAEWEELENEKEGELMDEYRLKALPWGLIDDIYRYISRLREVGQIPAYKSQEQKAAANWYHKMSKFSQEEQSPVVTFDFDETLVEEQFGSSYMFGGTLNPNSKMVSLLKLYHQNGYRIYIVTARYEREGEEVLAFVEQHQLPVEDVIFTGRQYKGPFLAELGSTLHFDDSKEEVEFAANMGINTRLVSPEDNKQENVGLKLWVDDERPMQAGYDLVARTADEAIRWLETGKVSHVSLDHDLGDTGEKTGYYITQWIERQSFDGKLGRLTWDVHSANPIGRENMRRSLNSAERFWDSNTSEQ